MYRWNPEDYARHSAGQEAWARYLLAGLKLRPDDAVLDIGCGDGRITAAIADRVPIDPARICLNPVTMAKSGIQTRRQARTWLPEFNLHLAGSIKAGSSAWICHPT
jgi:trans-aconitate methyltransferase